MLIDIDNREAHILIEALFPEKHRQDKSLAYKEFCELLQLKIIRHKDKLLSQFKCNEYERT